MQNDYEEFLQSKRQIGKNYGFKPIFIPDYLFDFQKYFTEWSVKKGRGALFAECGMGKGQPYGSKILTIDGWKKIEDLKLFDKVISSDGKAYDITGIFPKNEIDTYRFFYSDRISQVFDIDHLHICRTYNDRNRRKKWRVLSTKELLNNKLRYGKDKKSRIYDIPIVDPIEFDKKELYISPYVLGSLLGDGGLNGSIYLSNSDNQIINRVSEELPDNIKLVFAEGCTYRIKTGLTGNRKHKFRQEIYNMGLLNKKSYNKFIPEKYLFSDIKDRLNLLRGLMDTDGHITECGTCQFYSVSKKLINNVRFLIQSLGGIPTLSNKVGYYKKNCKKIRYRKCYILTFSLKTFNPFYIDRKSIKWNRNPRDNGRWIDKIEYEKKQKTICISVNSPDNSYITENCIVTHNTILQLVWAENIVRKTNKNVLILTPLAVSKQTEQEAEKFGIEAKVYNKKVNKITIINYEKLHYLDSNDFIGVVCDESGILKNFNGQTKNKVILFMRKIPYRFLYTATPSPNDYIELGNSSEALGYLGFIDMLNKFFKNEQNNSALRRMYKEKVKWRFKGYSQDFFWRWVSSWARTIRKPSDFGFDDDGFILPEKKENLHIIDVSRPYKGLIPLPAIGLKEERKERRATLNERCEKAAELINNSNKSAIAWCDYNVEGDLLEKLIPDAYQVAGKHSDNIKEERLLGFANNDFRVLITKGKIGGWGMNYQNCSHMTCFPSHSFERYYQTIRRCWRFGQKEKVIVDIISTKGEINVLKNLQKKQEKADRMFNNLLLFMNKSLKIDMIKKYREKEKMPLWLKNN